MSAPPDTPPPPNMDCVHPIRRKVSDDLLMRRTLLVCAECGKILDIEATP